MAAEVDLKKAMKSRSGTLASQVTDGTRKSCCSPVDCCGQKNISTDIYELGQLKAGGRFAVSDIVRRRNVVPNVQQNMELWTGCLAGSFHESVYRSTLCAAGFEGVDIKPTRIYQGADARELLPSETYESEKELDGAFMSACKPGVSS